MAHISLSGAYWCENCQSVIDSAISCPACASPHSIIPLVTCLNKGAQIEVHAALGSHHDSRL
jgi:hypothetical protein